MKRALENSWKWHRHWGQFWLIWGVTALVAAFLSRQPYRLALFCLAIVYFGLGVHHGFNALQKEAKEKGWDHE